MNCCQLFWCETRNKFFLSEPQFVICSYNSIYESTKNPAICSLHARLVSCFLTSEKANSSPNFVIFSCTFFNMKSGLQLFFPSQ